MSRHVVLGGAGHAHLAILDQVEEFIRRGCRVSLISPDVFWYSGMGPGVLSRTYGSGESQVDTGRLIREKGGTYFQDVICRIDAAERTVQLGSGKVMGYDLLSLNLGSHVSAAMIEGAEKFGLPVKPIANLARLRDLLEEKAAVGRSARLVVAGGGAAGCEVSINAWHLLQKNRTGPEIRIVTPEKSLMPREGRKAGEAVASELRRLGIGIAFGKKVVRAEPGRVLLDDGAILECDLLVLATGVRPPSLLRDSGLATARDGSLLVNEYLQSVAAPEIFGAGDCVGFAKRSPPRVGVYAVRESRILHDNLKASLDGRRLRRFRSPGNYLLILNLGDKKGLFLRNGYVLRGRWAFWLKDFLDRRFIEKYRP